MQDVTKTVVISLTEFINKAVEPDQSKDHIRYLAMHGKTMLMMYEATKDEKYLKQARLDYHRAKSIQECGFVRPLGVLLAG